MGVAAIAIAITIDTTGILPVSRLGLLRLLYKEDRVVIKDRIVVAAALSGDKASGRTKQQEEAQEVVQKELARAWSFLAELKKPVFPLRGRDVLAEGSLAAGPDVGLLLGEVEGWWVSREFEPHREACLEEMRRLLKERGKAA